MKAVKASRWHTNPLWFVALMAITVPVGAAIATLSRTDSLRTGLPCESRGPYDCSYDGALAFWFIFMTGFIIVAIAFGLVLAFRKKRAVAWTIAVIAAVVWAILYVGLLSGTRT